jgi:signal transduction histidine kinase
VLQEWNQIARATGAHLRAGLSCTSLGSTLLGNGVSNSHALTRQPTGLPLGTRWALVGWVVIVGGYAIASRILAPGAQLTEFGDAMQCVAALFAIAGLLCCTGRPRWRENAFWMLLALGCALWLAAQLIWTYIEAVQHREIANFFPGDIIYFLHIVPMLGALALVPHAERDEGKAHFRSLDLVLLLVWWVYLYVFTVTAWQYAAQNPDAYSRSYTSLANVENAALVLGLLALTWESKGHWRRVYGHLLGAATLYASSAYLLNRAIDNDHYFTGSVYDVPLVASFVWFGTAGLVARDLKAESQPDAPGWIERWPGIFAVAAVASMPLLALWSLRERTTPQRLRDFRVAVTQVALLIVAALVALRQRLVDRDRLRLLRASEESLEHVCRIQAQMVQQEKLASLGQLAAGAAHEINNPLTGIVGYAELLAEDKALDDRHRRLVEKIGEQARRIKHLVGSLLSFARRVPAERQPLDVSEVLKSAIGLSQLDLHGNNFRIETYIADELPAVRGDASQLLQVFFNVIDNAVDALEDLGGGVLTIRTEWQGAQVVIEFTDTGPGLSNPAQVFDPFYTTKPVGKGTGLGLSICYGILQEHGGRISCRNRPQGGAIFRIELPVAQELLKPALSSSFSRKSQARIDQS